MAQTSLTEFFSARKGTRSRPEKRQKCDSVSTEDANLLPAAKVVGSIGFIGASTRSPVIGLPGQLSTEALSTRSGCSPASSKAFQKSSKAVQKICSRKGKKPQTSVQPPIRDSFKRARERGPETSNPVLPVQVELPQSYSTAAAAPARLPATVTLCTDDGRNPAPVQASALTEPGRPQAALQPKLPIDSDPSSPGVGRPSGSRCDGGHSLVVHGGTRTPQVSQAGAAGSSGLLATNGNRSVRCPDPSVVAAAAAARDQQSGRLSELVSDLPLELADSGSSSSVLAHSLLHAAPDADAEKCKVGAKCGRSREAPEMAASSPPVTAGKWLVHGARDPQLKTKDDTRPATVTSGSTEACTKLQESIQPVHAYASAADNSLALPSKYRDLETMFGYCERIVAQMHNRRELCTFEKLKKGVEQMASRTFSRETLGQIVTVFPTAYHVRFETLPPAYGRNASDVTLEPNLDATSDCDTAVAPGGGSEAERPGSRKQFISLMVSRKQKFAANLMDIVKQHHEVFLSHLAQPFIVPEGRQIHRWHNSFMLEQVPDVPIAVLPWPKQQEAHPSARQVLGPKLDSHEKIQLALAKYESIVNAVLSRKQHQQQVAAEGSSNPNFESSSCQHTPASRGAAAIVSTSVTSTQELIDKAHSVLSAAAAAKSTAAQLRGQMLNPWPEVSGSTVAAEAQPSNSDSAAAASSCLPPVDAQTGSLLEKARSIRSAAAAAMPVAEQLRAQLITRESKPLTATAAPAAGSAAAVAQLHGSTRADLLKGVPASLLERVRQKEKLNTILAMVSRPEDDEERELLECLPNIASTIRTAFVIEKKPSLPWDVIVQKVQSADRLGMSRATAEKYIRNLLRIAPFWMAEAKTSKGVYVKIDVDMELSRVKQAIAKALEELKRRVTCC